MPKKMNMNISVNGQSRVPPGFRFHPTEEELLQYYLRKKVANDEIDLDVIFEVDLNKLEPWDIQEKCSIGTTPQNDWYFFSHKDKKYPTGTRTNRATTAGFWKATGRDKVIYSNCKRIGMRKTLVFYKGRAPHGQKSDWIMHEYRLDDFTNSDSDLITNPMNGDQVGQEEGWVVCRIFKKKNHIKTRVDSPILNTTFEPHHHSCLIDSSSDRDHDHDHHDDQGALDQIFQIIRTTTPNPNPVPNPNMKLPSLDSPNHITTHQPIPIQFENDIVSMMRSCGPDPNSESGLGDWAALDRFVATHLNGQTTSCDHLQLPPLMTSSSTSLLLSTNKIHNPAASATLDNYGGNENINIDHLWSFARSSSSSSFAVDPLCHVSDPGL